MHIVLLTMMALTGADADSVVAAPGSDSYYAVPAEAVAGDCAGGGCSASVSEEMAARHAAQAAEWQRRHMMPQTCYQPRYGCYYSGDRHMHRYPAFHGTYYRRPYNYRNLFEYPWHAKLHEPTSLFSYNVQEVEGRPLVIELDSGETPPPPPTEARRIRVGG